MAARMKSLEPEQFLAYARVFPQAWEAVLNAPIEHVVFGAGHISAYEDGTAPLIYVVFDNASDSAVERRFEARAIAGKYFRGFCAPELLCRQVAEFWAQHKQKQKNQQIARQVEQKAIQKASAKPAPVKPGSQKISIKNKRDASQKTDGSKQKQPKTPIVECPLCYKWLQKPSLREHYERLHPEYVMPAEPRKLTPDELKKYRSRPKRGRRSGPGVLTPISMRMIVVRRRR